MRRENSTVPESAFKQLSFRHLCLIFSELSKNSPTEIRRRVPGYLNQTEPSFITCSQSEQIPIVLSIYAYDAQAVMPSNDELLFCDASTTFEEVEAFMRRALASEARRIYTMLNVQELSYECASRVEMGYERLRRGKGEFVLVVVCCSERQADSIVASLFLNNRVSPVGLDERDLTAYLRRNLSEESNSFSRFEG